MNSMNNGVKCIGNLKVISPYNWAADDEKVILTRNRDRINLHSSCCFLNRIPSSVFNQNHWMIMLNEGRKELDICRF